MIEKNTHLVIFCLDIHPAKIFTMTSQTISIDRSHKKDVDCYIKEVLKEFTKKKTHPLLIAFYDWLQKNPNLPCEGTPLIELDAVFQRKKDKQQVLLYNDKYSLLLLQILRKYRMYSEELLKVFKNMKDLNTKIGSVYTFGPVLSERDNRLLRNIFAVLRKDCGCVKVLKPIERTKKRRGKFNGTESKKPLKYEEHALDNSFEEANDIFSDAKKCEKSEEKKDSKTSLDVGSINLIYGISLPVGKTIEKKYPMSKSIITDLESTLSNLRISVETKNSKK